MPRAFFNNNSKLNSGDLISKKSFNSKFRFDSSNCIVTNFNNNNNYLSVLKNYNNYCFNNNYRNSFNGSIYQGKYLLQANNNIDVCNKNNFFRNNYDICLNISTTSEKNVKTIFNSISYYNNEIGFKDIIIIQPWWNSKELARQYALEFINNVDTSTLNNSIYYFIYDRFPYPSYNICKYLSFSWFYTYTKNNLINHINNHYNKDSEIQTSQFWQNYNFNVVSVGN